jgi:hypothetical protein
MRYVSVLFMLLLIVLSGCAAGKYASPLTMQAFPQHYKEFDMKMGWEFKTDDGSTVVNGIAQNIRYYEMDDLEIWVTSLDAEGKELNRSVDYVYRLMENESGQFYLKIPQVASGSRVRFMYRYNGHDGGGDSGGSIAWRQSFEAVVP